MEDNNLSDNRDDNTVGRPKKRSARLLLVAVTVIVSAVIAVAGLKWYGQVDEYRQKVEDANAQIGKLQKQVDGTDEISQKSLPDQLEGTLKISEWGVYIRSTKSPMSYKLTTDKDGSENAWLTHEDAQQLKTQDGKKMCADDNEDGTPNHWYLTVITRSKKKLTDNFSKDREIAIIDGYYYYTSSSNGACSEEKFMASEAKARAELMDASEYVFKIEQ